MKARFIFFVLLFTFNILGCKIKKENRKYTTIENNGLTIKGYMISDTIFDDTVLFYNSTGNLFMKEFYANGKLNGVSEEFYPNGKIKMQTMYSNGLKNGLNRYFDSLGKPVYSDYFYYNLPVGPVVYYDSNEVASRFFFISFENRTLLDINYSTWKGVNEFVLNFINYTYELQKTDSVLQASLFLYLIQPPKISTKYSLYKRSKKNVDDQILVLNLSSEFPFHNYTLPILEDDYHYSLQLDIYDSILNKRSIIKREVW
jgi:antitoxin component YwqK of YwqJK toxin-antitoxin module